MADIIRTVGDGHANPDYSTLSLWNAGEGGEDPGEGFTSIALASGYCGAPASIDGTFIRGATIQGDIAFDGTNKSLLSNVSNLNIATGSGITVRDMYIYSTNRYLQALGIIADNILLERVFIEHLTEFSSAVSVNGGYPSSEIRNFVAVGGADTITCGYNRGIRFTNGVICGGTDKGVEGSNSIQMILENIHSFNSVGQNIDTAGSLNVTDCATEDSTGTYTGYGSSELVDFSAGNFQTKSTSILATISGNFIGAFLEAGDSAPTVDLLQFGSIAIQDMQVGIRPVLEVRLGSSVVWERP